MHYLTRLRRMPQDDERVALEDLGIQEWRSQDQILDGATWKAQQDEGHDIG